jgi:large conductance mechanosensitive channel
MGMISEFKAFIARGSVIDLAVAVVIGAAFGKIVNAIVDGFVMPVVALLTGGASVADWKYVITPAQLDAAGKQIAAEVAIKYGLLFQAAIDFLLIAFVIFLFLKAYNRLREPEAAAATPEDTLLLREIRDALARRDAVPR